MSDEVRAIGSRCGGCIQNSMKKVCFRGKFLVYLCFWLRLYFSRMVRAARGWGQYFKPSDTLLRGRYLNQGHYLNHDVSFNPVRRICHLGPPMPLVCVRYDDQQTTLSRSYPRLSEDYPFGMVSSTEEEIYPI